MNRTPDEIIDALAFALENGGVSTVLIGDNEAARLVLAWRERDQGLRLNPTHESADAFWKSWKVNGEPHKHGYYESTWGAINAAIKEGGLVAAPPKTSDSIG